MATIANISARIDKLEQIEDVIVVLPFKRDPAAFSEAVRAVVDARPSHSDRVERLLASHTGDVRKTLELVLEGVPDSDIRAVYDRAIETAIAAAGRGQGESPSSELAEATRLSVGRNSDVSEAVKGYGANLDLEEDEKEQRKTLEEALQEVAAHNLRVRERAQKG